MDSLTYNPILNRNNCAEFLEKMKSYYRFSTKKGLQPDKQQVVDFDQNNF